jgi:Cofactor assembly of complex C subunit B
VSEFSLTSSLILTLLLLVGLIFFLKSSVKDRTTEMLFKHPDRENKGQEDQILQQVRTYLTARAFQVTNVDRDRQVVTLSGRVAPSISLMILLMLMAAVGFGCLSLVLGILLPEYDRWFWLSLLAVPGVGIFYWRGANRIEQVSFGWRSDKLWVRAHKDEITTLQQALGLERQ